MPRTLIESTRVPFTECRAERVLSLPSPPSCSPGKSQDPITRVSSIVMQITITNRRQGRGPLRYRGTRISSFFLSPRLVSPPFSPSHLLVLPPWIRQTPRIRGRSEKEDPGRREGRKRNRDFDRESIFRCNVNAPAGQWASAERPRLTLPSPNPPSPSRREMLTPARWSAKTRREHRPSVSIDSVDLVGSPMGNVNSAPRSLN